MNDLDQAPELHSGELLAAFARHEVQFLIVGGFGAQLYGATRLTNDVDMCPASGQENFTRLAAALQELDAQLRLRPELGDVEVRPTARLLRDMPITRWRTRAGDVDVIIAIPAGERGKPLGFRELNARAAKVRIGGVTILVLAPVSPVLMVVGHAPRTFPV